MDGTFQKIIMYKLNHPAVKKDILETHHLLNKQLFKKDKFSLNISSGRLLINEEPMGNNEQGTLNLEKYFTKHLIGGVTFIKGLRADELTLFFKILLAGPESIKNAGGIKSILNKGKAVHLKINEERYARVDDDQVVVDRETYEIEDEREKLLDIGVEEEIKATNPFEAEVLEEIRKIADSSTDYRDIYKTIIKNLHEEIERATDGIRKEKKKIEFEKKRTESVIRSMSEGVVVVDEKGKVLMMNPAAEQILETKKDERVGAHITEGLKEHQMVSISSAFKESDEDKVKEFNISGTEDTQRTVRDSMAVVENEDGKTIGMVSVLTDITKQKELDDMKSEFLSKVTHELRTPLAAIKQTISMILEQTAGAINETQNKFLSIAKKNIERLNRLINDLLDLSKLEAGKMKLKVEKGKIDDVLLETISTFQAWASEKGISISSNIVSPISAFSFDRDKVIQVVTNLMSNALKFTPKGGEIIISAKQLNEEQSVPVEVSVEDSGPGIIEDDQKKIFDKFVQVGKKGLSEIKGTGLGLPIVKEIIELHGGRIWIKSPAKENKGSRFTFTLPNEE